MTNPVADHWPEASLSLTWLLALLRAVKISPWHPCAILAGKDTSNTSRHVLCADSILAETDLHAPCSDGFALSPISVLCPHVGLDY